ncbi:ABC transporter permease subunit [Aerococcaceae bacterium 50-4]
MFKGQKKSSQLILLLPFIILVLLFEVLPLLSIVVNGFKTPIYGGFTLDNFVQVFTSDYYVQSISNSLFVSFISTFIGLFIAVLSAYAIHMSSPKLRQAFISILNATANFQGIVLAFAFIILLGNAGIFTTLGIQFSIPFLEDYNLYTTSGILITFIYFQIPLGTLLLYPSFDAVKEEYKEAAALMQASSFTFWTKIGLPIVLPSIFGTFSVLFSNALAAYATPNALLGNNYALLPIRISSMFTGDVIQQVELGSALSLVMLLIMGVMTLLSTFILKKTRKGGKS